MGQGLYVKRETYPSVIPGEDVMFIFREHGEPAADARLYIVALDPATSYRVRSGRGPQWELYDNVSGTTNLAARGQRGAQVLPVGADPLDNVTVLECLTGRLAVTVVSPHPVQTQIRIRSRRTV